MKQINEEIYTLWLGTLSNQHPVNVQSTDTYRHIDHVAVGHYLRRTENLITNGVVYKCRPMSFEINFHLFEIVSNGDRFDIVQDNGSAYLSNIAESDLYDAIGLIKSYVVYLTTQNQCQFMVDRYNSKLDAIGDYEG